MDLRQQDALKIEVTKFKNSLHEINAKIKTTQALIDRGLLPSRISGIEEMKAESAKIRAQINEAEAKLKG